MYHPAESDDYSTEYLHWPDSIPRLCVCCNKILKFAFVDNGKLVRTLDGPIHQVIDLYTCENPDCELNNYYINPIPRYDFGASYFGKDVLRRVAKELLIYKQTPDLIHLRLTDEYGLVISLRTVQRMCRDILLTKSDKIDEETLKIIQKQGWILLAVDGQDPGVNKHALWLFTDAVSGRVLKTVVVNSMSHPELHEFIEAILQHYKVPLIGTVSDKQNNIVKCMQTYYPSIPHQYCTFHFLQNLWGHLEIFDTQIFTAIKKALNDLYIHDTSKLVLVDFKEFGKNTVVDMFAPLDRDLQKMLHARSKKFQSLRGLWLYRTIKNYAIRLQALLSQVENNPRIAKILHKTILTLESLLSENKVAFADDLFLFESFKTIEQRLYSNCPERADRQIQLDDIFGTLWAIARCKDSSLQLNNLKSFLPKAGSPTSAILGEWVRLWNNYMGGLFNYYDFPKDVFTNGISERAFSKEKMTLFKRMAKKEVGAMIETYGELYLRIGFSDPTEIKQDIVDQYDPSRLKQLRTQFDAKWQVIQETWLIKSHLFEGPEHFLSEIDAMR